MEDIVGAALLATLSAIVCVETTVVCRLTVVISGITKAAPVRDRLRTLTEVAQRQGDMTGRAY
jgi:hypothetical protein